MAFRLKFFVATEFILYPLLTNHAFLAQFSLLKQPMYFLTEFFVSDCNYPPEKGIYKQCAVGRTSILVKSEYLSKQDSAAALLFFFCKFIQELLLALCQLVRDAYYYF